MKTILIIDDEQEIVAYLSRFIERHGVNTLSALSGEEGISIFKEKHPDCVFLDFHLPKMDGIEVLKKIKKINTNVAVYFITGDQNLAVRTPIESLDIKGFILKPLNIEDVVKIIENI